MAQSYISVANIIQQFIDQHKGLQGRGQIEAYEQLNNFSHEGTRFPLMYAESRSVAMDSNADIYTFRIYCVDLLSTDRINEMTIRNQTLLILRDFVNWVTKDYLNNIRVISNVPVATPVNNFLMDKTAGWYLDIDFETTTIISDCAIPFFDQPYDQGVDCDIQYITPFLTCETLTECENYINIVNNSVNTISLSAGTIYSGGTNLYDIFSSDIVRVQSGLNTYTGGTPVNPTVNVSGGTFGPVYSTSLSGAVLYSGNTNLYDIFLTPPDANDVTRVQHGINTFTGGTDNAPTVNITGGTFNSIFSTNLSGGSIFSGATNINQLFGNAANVLLGTSNVVYIAGTPQDAANMGGAANNVYTAFQDAYNRANQLATGTSRVLINVLNTTSGATGNLILTGDYNTNIRIEGYSFNTSNLGNIITSASTGSSFNVGGTGVTQAVFFSNVNLGSIITVAGSSGSSINAGRVNVALNSVIMGAINTSVPIVNWLGNGGTVMIGGSGSTVSQNTFIPNTTIGRVGNITTQARTFTGTAGSVTINAPYYNFGTIITSQNNMRGNVNITNAGEIISINQNANNSGNFNNLSNIKSIILTVFIGDTGGTTTITNTNIIGAFTYNGAGVKTFNVTNSSFQSQLTCASTGMTNNLNNVYVTSNLTLGGTAILKNCNISNGNFTMLSGSPTLSILGCQFGLQVFANKAAVYAYNSSFNSPLNDIGRTSNFFNCALNSFVFNVPDFCSFRSCGIATLTYLPEASGASNSNYIYNCSIDDLLGIQIPTGVIVYHKNSYINPDVITGGGKYIDLEQDITKNIVSATTLYSFGVKPTQVAYAADSYSAITGSSSLTYVEPVLQIQGQDNTTGLRVKADSTNQQMRMVFHRADSFGGAEAGGIVALQGGNFFRIGGTGNNTMTALYANGIDVINLNTNRTVDIPNLADATGGTRMVVVDSGGTLSAVTISSGSTILLQPTQVAFGNSSSGLTGSSLFTYTSSGGMEFLDAGYIKLGNISSYFGLDLSAFGISEIRNSLSKIILDRITSFGRVSFNIQNKNILIANFSGVTFGETVETESTARVDIQSATTALPALRIRSGETFIGNLDGSIWNDGSHLYGIFGGSVKQLDNDGSPVSATLNPGQIGFGNSSSGLTGNSNFIYDSVNEVFKIGSATTLSNNFGLQIKPYKGSTGRLYTSNYFQNGSTTDGALMLYYTDPNIVSPTTQNFFLYTDNGASGTILNGITSSSLFVSNVGNFVANAGFNNGIKTYFNSIYTAVTTPTAIVDIQESTPTFAPLRIRSGTTVSSPLDGSIWNDGSHLYGSIGGQIKQLDNGINYITDNTAISLLTATTNWTLTGIYTGTTLTNVFAGQKYRDLNYLYEMYTSTEPIRLARV